LLSEKCSRAITGSVKETTLTLSIFSDKASWNSLVVEKSSSTTLTIRLLADKKMSFFYAYGKLVIHLLYAGYLLIMLRKYQFNIILS
jgi:hypothetical protein